MPIRRPNFLIVSFGIHIVIFFIIVCSFDWQSRLLVVENTNKQDVISAMVLGDSPESKILPDKKPLISPKPVKPLPLPKTKKPVLQKPDKKVIALQKAPAKKKKPLVQKNMFAKDLLADIQKQVVAKKQLKQKHLKDTFEKTLHEQAEKSMRQHLLDEDIRLKAKADRLARGEINKYQALIIQAIGENWIVPVGADKKLTCELMISVAENGSVSAVQITKTSGDPALDRSARAAVLKASPLPVPKNHAAFTAFKQFVLKVKPENVIPGDNSFGPG